MNIFTFTKLGRVVVLAAVMVASMVVTAAAQQKGTFKDSRNGQTYKTVVIGGKKWMAENLNYKTGTSWCYEDNDSRCQKYGRLYDWNTAKSACPKGWHLPTREEWGQLAVTAGGTGDYGVDGAAGAKLKDKGGWIGNNVNYGTDDFGFSALAGGYWRGGGGFGSGFDGGRWDTGIWWTATEHGESTAYERTMWYSSDKVSESVGNKYNGYSLRCVSN